MDFLQIRDRIDALITLGGWSNAIPQPDLAQLANDGLRLFTRQAKQNCETLLITTVADQADYDITDPDDPRDWLSFFDDALYNSNLASGASWLQQTTRDNLRIMDRTWRNAPSGTPIYWYWANPTTIGLYSPPSVSDVEITFYGPRHEPVLVSDSQEPLFNEDFHEGICLFGAWLYGKLYARGEERSVAEGYYTEAMVYVASCKQSMAAQEAALVQRRVGRAPQEYMGSGSMMVPLWPWN